MKPAKKRKLDQRDPVVGVIVETQGDVEASSRRRSRERRRKDKSHSLQSGAGDRKSASEKRRLKRKDERYAETICFACRERGHAAKDCTKNILSTANDNSDQRGERNPRLKTGRTAVGICYRCSSRKHSLSRCKEPEDPSNPLPYASCFVCSGKGHLASSCPENQAKGIYPNGGCCKLCGDTMHLAKDCKLRQKEVADTTVFLGTGNGAGADEDDFHTFRRRNAEVDKLERIEERVKKQANMKVGAHSGTVKSYAKKPIASTRKVVYF
ncbi:hypothetical protein WOLCODRAFT_128311 [Wolfiporia cocos MD-104 SS10]|uniref:CCHC-type domain-containing protein n=1 Tax=Wolfiporia cocos (strain MD-104) TaxID=742152 RepID=A0A2H3J647_WOLCO|nr:hypothetical protein WOLCODRAFT_128311 [Wolfiporia cocos MD-104 SS10]